MNAYYIHSPSKGYYYYKQNANYVFAFSEKDYIQKLHHKYILKPDYSIFLKFEKAGHILGAVSFKNHDRHFTKGDASVCMDDRRMT